MDRDGYWLKRMLVLGLTGVLTEFTQACASSALGGF